MSQTLFETMFYPQLDEITFLGDGSQAQIRIGDLQRSCIQPAYEIGVSLSLAFGDNPSLLAKLIGMSTENPHKDLESVFQQLHSNLLSNLEPDRGSSWTDYSELPFGMIVYREMLKRGLSSAPVPTYGMSNIDARDGADMAFMSGAGFGYLDRQHAQNLLLEFKSIDLPTAKSAICNISFEYVSTILEESDSVFISADLVAISHISRDV